MCRLGFIIYGTRCTFLCYDKLISKPVYVILMIEALCKMSFIKYKIFIFKNDIGIIYLPILYYYSVKVNSGEISIKWKVIIYSTHVRILCMKFSQMPSILIYLKKNLYEAPFGVKLIGKQNKFANKK